RFGGKGTDVMEGGAGDDEYWVGSIPVTIVENPGSGTDTIRAFADFDLSASLDTANIENLILVEVAAVGKGNGLNNVITGNEGDDTLDGGIGADTMAGGEDNDSYKVNDAGDKIV